jgi:hypothetical protein
MMRQSGNHLSLLFISAVSFLLPDHHRVGTPRAPKMLLPAVGLSLATPAEEAGLIEIYPPLALADQPPYLLLVTLVLAVIAIALALFLLLRRYRSAPPPKPDPGAAALVELDDALRLLAGSESTRFADYAETVSAILRRYFEQRFNLSATRRTTAEFVNSLRAAPETNTSRSPEPINEHLDDLLRCFQLCDLVKFSGLSPEPAGIDHLTRTVRSFIETTRDRSTATEA